jgi:hypothetical protein
LTEFEFVEAAGIFSGEIGQAPTNMITVIFAYVVAVHFAGKDLSKTVAISISLIYSLWIIGPMINFVFSWNQYMTILDLYHSAYPEGQALRRFLSGKSFIIIVSLAPFIIGWIGSLLYTHRVVRGKRE